MKPVKEIVTFTVVIVCGWVVARTGFSGHSGSGDFAVANNHEHYDAQEGDHNGREKGIHGLKSTQCSARYLGQRPFFGYPRAAFPHRMDAQQRVQGKQHYLI